MWVVDMEKKLDGAEPSAKVAKWQKHCIFRVPPRLKTVDGSVYKPQTVAFGPFHHDDEDLKPMEEHKLRAVLHLLHQASKTLGELASPMEEVADELEGAYMDLGGEWRGENRGRFLAMMIADGYFLLEVMRTVAGKQSNPTDYAHDDPVFSWHGIQHIKSFVQRDMFMVENQLPLLVLDKIVAVESSASPNAASMINTRVLKFQEGKDAPEGTNQLQLGRHPLDIYRKSQLKVPKKALHRGVDVGSPVAPAPRPGGGSSAAQPTVPRSALKLSEAGIHFRPSKTICLDDVEFNNGSLKMPKVLLDDNTAYKFHNMMAFEAMHVSTGNDVTAFVLFVKDLMDSADDVRLLVRKRILQHDLADNDDAVVSLFNGLTRDVSKNWDSKLCRVREDVEHHYGSNRLRVFLCVSWANLKSKYFRSPWTLLVLATAILLIVADIMQAVYAVMSYDPNKDKPKRH